MIALAILLQVATAPAPQVPDALDQFLGCVAVQARSLEPSGEPATTIADVAASKCERLKSPAADLLVAEFRAKPEIKRYEENYPLSSSTLDEMRGQRLQELSETARNVALRVVVERRALAKAR